MKLSSHYLLLIGVLIACLMIPDASALLDHKVVDNSKIDQWGYPTLEVKDIINQKISSYKLISHTSDCLINCESILEICQYFDGNIADGIEFKDSMGNPLTMKALRLSVNYSEEYNVQVPDKEICQDVDRSVYNGDLKKNETKKVNECSMTYKDKIETKESFKDYDYKSLSKGCYKLKIEAKKDAMQKLDWVIESKNIKMPEMAWWNAAWAYKKEITLSGNIGQNYTAEINVSFVAGKMNADWSDIRFLNHMEAIELGFRNVTQNATDATFHVRVDSSDPIFMYYGNAAAGTTSKWRNAYQCGDDFSDNVKINITDIMGGTSTVSGGEINLTSGGNEAWRCANKINYQNYTILARNKIQSHGFGIMFRINDTNGTMIHDRFALSDKLIYYSYNNYITNNLVTNDQTTVYDSNANSYYTSVEIVNGSQYKRYEDGTFIKTTVDTFLMGTSSYVGFSCGANMMTVDWYYVMPDILGYSYSVGAEQNSNSLDVVLNVPINGYNSTSKNVLFNCSGVDETGVLNLTLIINDADNYTLSQGAGITNLSLQVTRNRPDGEYNWTCRASDGTNTAIKSNRNFTIDSTNPDIVMIYPLNTTYNYNVTEINTTYFDVHNNSDNSNCKYVLNALPEVYFKCNDNLTGLPSNEGSNTWVVYANDSFGNVNATSVTFFKDTVYPTIDYTSGTAADGAYLSQNYVFINTTWTESNFRNITFQITSGMTLWKQTYTTPTYLYNLPGIIDGLYFYNVTLCDVANNCNMTATRNLTIDMTSPDLTIVYPENISYNINVSELNYTIYDLNPLTATCLYTINGVVTPVLVGINVTDAISIEGSNEWDIMCSDEAGNINISNVTFFKDTVYPQIDWGVGTEADGVFVIHDNIYLNLTWSESNFHNLTFRYYSATSGMGHADYIVPIYEYNFTSLADELYWYNATICDVVNNCNTTSTRNITLDHVPPSISEILYPTANDILQYAAAGYDINFSAYDAAGLGGCKYKIDSGIWTIIPCNSNLTATTFNIGDHDVRFNVTDAAGNSNWTSLNFTVFDFLYNNYDTHILESSIHSFSRGINTSANVIVNATFIYNSTKYTTGIIKTGGAWDATYNKSITIPLQPFQNRNVPFNWDFNLTYNGHSENYSNTTFQQNVSQFLLKLCDGSAVFQKSANFTTVDQADSARLNESTFKGTLNYYISSWAYNRTFSYDNYSDTGEFDFCIYPNYASIYSDLNSKYTRTGYKQGSYVLGNHAFNNATQNITLYMINATGTTDLVVKVVDSNLVIQKGIFSRLQRYYPGSGLWIEIESDTTDELGQAIFHVIEKEVTYKFLLSNSTNLLKITDPIKVVCYAVPCEITLTIEPSQANQFFNFKPISGFSYSESYDNNTGMFTYSFIDTSGTLTLANLTVTQINSTSSPIICSNSTTGASGTLQCNVSLLSGTFIANAYGTFNGKKYLIDTVSASINNAWKTFGKEGMFWAIIFLISLAMVGIWNPAVSVGMLVVGTVMVSLLGIIALPWIALISIIIIGGIVISQLKT